MPDRRRILAAGVVLLALSCNEPTAPEDRGGVEVVAEIVSGPSTVIYEEWPWLQCDIRFVANSQGKGRVRWYNATTHWYYGVDRSVPLDTLILTGADIENAFVSDSLVGAGTDTAFFRTSGPAPFEIETIFRYGRGDRLETHTTTARIACGPAIPPGSTAPVVEIISVTSADPEPEPGDVIDVRYRATGGAGIWYSGIEFAGAFGGSLAFPEAGVASRDRTASFVIPARVEFAFPVRVLAYAFDAGLRPGSTDTTTAIILRDHTPPTLTATLSGGDWATFDTVRVQGTASDNHSLSWIVWQLGEPAISRDSMRLQGVPNAQYEFDLRIQARPEWLGLATRLTIWARDSSGQISLPVTSSPSAYSFYEGIPTPPLLVSYFGTPGGPMGGVHDVLYDPKRSRLYASHTGNHVVTSFDLASMSRGPSLETGAWPGGLALTPSGDSLVVTQSLVSALSVVRLDDFTLLAPVPMLAMDSTGGAFELLPTGVEVAGNGIAVVQTIKRSVGGTRTLTVDLTNGTSRSRLDAPAGVVEIPHWWRRLGTSPDRTRVAIFDVACARFYRALTDDFSSCQPEQYHELGNVTFSSDGQRIAFHDGLYDAALNRLGTLGTSFQIVAPDGQSVLSLAGKRLRRIRVSDGKILRSMLLPFEGDGLILLNDEQTIVVFSRGTSELVKVPLSGL